MQIITTMKLRKFAKVFNDTNFVIGDYQWIYDANTNFVFKIRFPIIGVKIK